MREGIPQSSIQYTPHIASIATRRSPPREAHDNRQNMPYTTHSLDYRPVPATYGASPGYPPAAAQPFDSRELQYGAYWSTSK